MELIPVEMGLDVPAKYTTGFRYPNLGRHGVPRGDNGMYSRLVKHRGKVFFSIWRYLVIFICLEGN